MTVAKAKGSSILLVVKLLRANRVEAVARLAPELRQYLDERILVSSWYPEADLFELLKVGVALAPQGGEDPWLFFGRFAAAAHVRDVYRNLLARAPEEVLRQINVVWRTQHDTGTFRADLVETGHAVISLEDHATVGREWCRLLHGYMVGMLEAAGAKEIAVREIHCRNDGDPTCVWRLNWTFADPTKGPGA